MNGLAFHFERDVDIRGRDMNIIAVVSPYLKSQNDVKNQCEEEARQNKGILNLGGGGEQPGETAKDLCSDSKGGQLPSGPCPVILCDLREFGE